MRHEFLNQTPIAIQAGPPNTIRSTIKVTGFGQATLNEIEVRVDISHTWTNDLIVRLKSPDETEVVLVQQKGGSSDDFSGTIFRNAAATPISQGSAPFAGTFRPEGNLSDFDGDIPDGVWTLEIEDTAMRDGGALNQWTLGFSTSDVVDRPFTIDVRFLGGLTPNQQSAFAKAATRWSQIIVGDVPPVSLDGEVIDDILIEARGIPIDGTSGVLGQAGPSHIRPGSGLPVKGIMSFDAADLARMETDGSLEDVILHEMAHVLGFGTLWNELALLTGEGSIDPTFVGVNAMREYGALRSQADPNNPNAPTRVPVANTGGPGTRDGHWREVVLGDELLTGFISGTVRPISRTSIACFEDMGYRVNYEAADGYALPSMLQLAEMGLFGLRQSADTCTLERVIPIVVPPSAVLNHR